MAAQYTRLPDGRWFFQQGPMDIVIGAEGDTPAVEAAHAAARQRFATLLDELVAELPLLRQPVAAGERCALQGAVACRMWHACAPFAQDFITPMAAVAGAVAQELIACYARPGVARAWVNNGGDIALHLGAGTSARVGLYADISQLQARDVIDGVTPDGFFDVQAAQPVRGVATSGWRGRSFSLGIADSVTVLAATAAQADAAATVIANAVNVDDARIVRRPASEVKDNSDLGHIAVTVDVPVLPSEKIQQALAAGLRCAADLQAQGLVFAAALVCQGRMEVLPGEPAGRAKVSGPFVQVGERAVPGAAHEPSGDVVGSVFA